MAAAVIPVDFRGAWNMVAADCGTTSEGSMTVEAHALRLYEGGGPVTSVVRRGNVITVTATWNAEGTVEKVAFDMRLSPDGETITNLTTGAVSHRCH